MKKFLVALLFLAALCPTSGQAQVMRYLTKAGTPTACSPPFITIDTTNSLLYFFGTDGLCHVAGGGATDVTSDTLTANTLSKGSGAHALTNSQITDTGSLITIPGITSLSTATLSGGSPLVFDGTTPDANKTTLVVTDPTGARTFTLPNANSVGVQPDTGAASNFLTAVSALGAISKAQPAFTDISGVATAAQGGFGITNPVAVLTSAMGGQTSATCTNITSMTWNIAASKNYVLDCNLPTTLAASATIAYCLGGPGTATSYSLSADGDLGTAGIWSQVSTLAQTSYGTKTGASASVAASSVIHVHATIQNGSTASGTAQTLQTAANGTNAITNLANGSCVLNQVN